MGQQIKYHITDNGDIFKINEDGSFSTIGNIQSLNTNTEVTDKITQPGLRKWRWILIVSWITQLFMLLALIACVILLYFLCDSNDHIKWNLWDLYRNSII